MWEFDVAPRGKFYGRRAEALRNWVFAPELGPQASKDQLRKQWTYWETYCPLPPANLSV